MVIFLKGPRPLYLTLILEHLFFRLSLSTMGVFTTDAVLAFRQRPPSEMVFQILRVRD